VRTDSADELWIHHNTSIVNCGFIENEFWELGGQGEDWVVAYNVIDDHQWFIDLGPGGDSIIAHNTISIRETDPPCPYHFAMTRLPRLRGRFVNNILLSYGGIRFEGVPSEHRRHNIFFSTDDETANPAGPEMGEGDREIDPMCVDPAGSDFRLLPGNPAIDMGINAGLTHDIFRRNHAGNPVPAGSARDIGAFEFTAERKP
jgi:hypothetical protein